MFIRTNIVNIKFKRMKNSIKIFVVVPIVIGIGMFILGGNRLYAGNEQRAGQAGASELLINPWARSSGWGGANSASVRGLEAMFLNVAGTAFTTKTELLFARTEYISIADISINAFGFSQRIGATNVLGLALMSMNFGDIPVTTVEMPEGNIGTFSPTYINIGLSYAHEFSNSIFGGTVVKLITENGTSDATAMGVALDAGIQYVTPGQKLKFGISIKNVGAPMRFAGAGLSFRGNEPGGDYNMTLSQRSETFELPSLINIGVSYDFTLIENHRLTTAATFTSNSFTNDQYIAGIEYGFKNLFMIRGGYTYEKKIEDFEENKMTFFTGLCGGLTLQVPVNKKGSTINIDYSYRVTNPFNGVHSVGASINL